MFFDTSNTLIVRDVTDDLANHMREFSLSHLDQSAANCCGICDVDKNHLTEFIVQKRT